MMKQEFLRFAFSVLTIVAIGEAAVVHGALVVRRAQGANAATILSTVNQFRTDLGGVDNGTGSSYLTGRREISWEEIPDAGAAPNVFALDFFNTTVPRGVILSTPCNASGIFFASADSSNPTSTPVRYGHFDPSYPSTFTTFSGERLISTGGSCNITDVKFFVPGTSTPATVRGFGLVFTDVDRDMADAAASRIHITAESGTTVIPLSGVAAGPSNGGLSFVGVSFNAGERIRSVQIISGITGLGTGVVDGVNGAEIVVMDDFIYGEPRATEFHPGDADGDGVSDARIFRPSNGTWYTLNSGTNTVSITSFGSNGDLPVDGDFDGDSRADLGIFRPSNGQWWFQRSSTGAVFAATFGQNGDRPVPGDYDRDGETDLAVWRPSNGNYYVLRSSTNYGTFYSFPFGQNGDIPVY